MPHAMRAQVAVRRWHRGVQRQEGLGWGRVTGAGDRVLINSGRNGSGNEWVRKEALDVAVVGIAGVGPMAGLPGLEHSINFARTAPSSDGVSRDRTCGGLDRKWDSRES